jgi:hypothetical protein
MIATVDQRVKTLLGDLIVQLQAANMRIEELQAELAALKPHEIDVVEKRVEGNGAAESRPNNG